MDWNELEPGQRVEVTTLHHFDGFYVRTDKDPVTGEEIGVFGTDPYAHLHPTNSGMRAVPAKRLHSIVKRH